MSFICCLIQENCQRSPSSSKRGCTENVSLWSVNSVTSASWWSNLTDDSKGTVIKNLSSSVSVHSSKLVNQHIYVCNVCMYTHTHTYNCFTALLYMSGTTRVSRYQKGKTRKVKTNLDLLEQDSEWKWQWHLLGYMQVCTSSQTTTPTSHHSIFYRPDALPAAQPTASKHWRQCMYVRMYAYVYTVNSRWAASTNSENKTGITHNWLHKYILQYPFFRKLKFESFNMTHSLKKNKRI